MMAERIIIAKLISAEKEDYFDLVPECALQALQDVMEEGEKKGKISWDLPVDYHINKALSDLTDYMLNNQSVLSTILNLENRGMKITDDHKPYLEHAFAQLMMAVAIKRRNEEKK